MAARKKITSVVVQCEFAGGAHQQLHADVRFQSCHRFGDGGYRYAELGGGGGKAAAFRHAHKSHHREELVHALIIEEMDIIICPPQYFPN